MAKHKSHADRRAQFERQASASRRPPFAVLAAAAFFLVVIVGVITWRASATEGAQAHAVTAGGGSDVAVDAAPLADGQARFFTYAARDGRQVRFFVVKSTDGVVRAAVDACDVCFRERRGYRQEGTSMVCNNCNKAFPTDRVNEVKGGCNPVPLERELRNGSLVITSAALEQGASYF